MKIVKLETFTTEFVGFVRATADSGAEGWGQVSTYNADITCEIFHRQVARHALGTDALDFADTLASPVSQNPSTISSSVLELIL